MFDIPVQPNPGSLRALSDEAVENILHPYLFMLDNSGRMAFNPIPPTTLTELDPPPLFYTPWDTTTPRHLPPYSIALRPSNPLRQSNPFTQSNSSSNEEYNNLQLVNFALMDIDPPAAGGAMDLTIQDVTYSENQLRLIEVERREREIERREIELWAREEHLQTQRDEAGRDIQQAVRPSHPRFSSGTQPSSTTQFALFDNNDEIDPQRSMDLRASGPSSVPGIVRPEGQGNSQTTVPSAVSSQIQEITCLPPGAFLLDPSAPSFDQNTQSVESTLEKVVELSEEAFATSNSNHALRPTSISPQDKNAKPQIQHPCNSLAMRARKKKKRPEIPGCNCYPLNGAATRLARVKSVRTKEALEKTKEVRKVGACLLCRYLKKEVRYWDYLTLFSASDSLSCSDMNIL
jgi:hypothetical protein